jgi:gliding motility-associated-like protein
MFDPAKAKPGINTIVYQTHSMPTPSLCPDRQEVLIKVVKVPQVTPMSGKFESCAPAEFFWSVPTNVGKATWIAGDGSESKEGFAVNHIYTSAGIYSVQVHYSLDGCSMQKEFAQSFTVYPQPEADFEMPAEILISAPNLQVINTTSPLGENTYSWKIDGIDVNNAKGEVNPSFDLSKLGRYNITLTAENIHGCKDEVTKTVEVKNDFNIYIPTSFSPNFDGLNDKFMPVFSPYGLDAKSYEMEVFDRWGHAIFRTTDVSKGWDGSVGNKGEILKEGVYIYKIRYKDLDGNAYSKMGHVSMLK